MRKEEKQTLKNAFKIIIKLAYSILKMIIQFLIQFAELTFKIISELSERLFAPEKKKKTKKKKLTKKELGYARKKAIITSEKYKWKKKK